MTPQNLHEKADPLRAVLLIPMLFCVCARGMKSDVNIWMMMSGLLAAVCLFD